MNSLASSVTLNDVSANVARSDTSSGESGNGNISIVTSVNANEACDDSSDTSASSKSQEATKHNVSFDTSKVDEFSEGEKSNVKKPARNSAWKAFKDMAVKSMGGTINQKVLFNSFMIPFTAFQKVT